MEVTSDGVLRLRYTGNRHDPVLSMSLFGRRWKILSNSIMNHDDVLMIVMISGWMVIPHLPRYEDDSPRPDQFCPGEEN